VGRHGIAFPIGVVGLVEADLLLHTRRSAVGDCSLHLPQFFRVALKRGKTLCEFIVQFELGEDRPMVRGLEEVVAIVGLLNEAFVLRLVDDAVGPTGDALGYLVTVRVLVKLVSRSEEDFTLLKILSNSAYLPLD
jgi:hypothetical protein